MAAKKPLIKAEPAKKVNKNAKPDLVEQSVVSDEEYRCTCCGHKYKKQETNFNRSKSPIFAGNNGYLSICCNCVAKLYEGFVKFYDGDEDAAAERICQITDMYFNPEIWAMSRKISESRRGKSRNRISTYVSRLNLTQADRATTYSDTLIRRWEANVENAETVAEVEQNPDIKTSPEAVRKYGTGFTAGDYDSLEYEYQNWVTENGKPMDKRQEELYISACYLKLNIQKLLQKGDANIGPAIANYKAQIEAVTTEIEDRKKKAEEKQVDPVGLMIRDIEEFAPADYYKDKKLYKDYDHLLDYFKRHILRPLRNLLTGSKELDKEFSLSDTEE